MRQRLVVALGGPQGVALHHRGHVRRLDPERAVGPLDGLVHVLDFPEPEAGDEFLGFGEGPVYDGAAGAIEAIFSILAIRDNIAPPTINLDNPSVQTGIDLVPHNARKREINVALSNSFGFGGTNASVILQRVIN